jgi:hypothetical protein
MNEAEWVSEHAACPDTGATFAAGAVAGSGIDAAAARNTLGQTQRQRGLS